MNLGTILLIMGVFVAGVGYGIYRLATLPPCVRTEVKYTCTPPVYVKVGNVYTPVTGSQNCGYHDVCMERASQ